MRRIRLALLSCGGLLAAVLLAEIGLRIGSPAGVPFAMQWGVDDRIEQRANQASRESYGMLTFDADGLRAGSGLPFDRSILFLGDSFTEGHGVSDEQTFARATERALRREGLMVRSLNAGRRGFGAAQELAVLRRMLGRFPVDAIVVQSFPMNDLSDNLAYGGFGIEGGRLIEYDPPRPPLRARVNAALAVSRLRDLYVVRTAANAIAARNGAAPYDSPISFELEHALLGEIVATARGRSIPIVMLVVPTKLVQLVRAEARKSPEQIGELERFARVRELVKGFGVPWIDAGAIIRDIAADAAKGDGSHFSPAGCELIGEAIARHLEPLLRSSTAR